MSSQCSRGHFTPLYRLTCYYTYLLYMYCSIVNICSYRHLYCASILYMSGKYSLFPCHEYLYGSSFALIHSVHPTDVRCVTVRWLVVSTVPVTVSLETVCARSLLKGTVVMPASLVSASWKPLTHQDAQQVCAAPTESSAIPVVTSGIRTYST